MWAWLLFRVSGLILAFYLFAHIYVISRARLGGHGSLNSAFKMFDKPFFVFLDFMLVAAVLYHGLNGVRVVLMDLGYGIHRHKAVFWACMAVAAATLTVFAVVAAPHIF